MTAEQAHGGAPAPSKEHSMLLRIGNVEAEVKVAALMSTPRLGFTDNF